MQLASAAIGGAAGGGAGASTALAGDAFNRQLHPNEIKLITGELAAKYAAEHPGVSERDAEAILINQSLRQVDDAWAGKLGPDDNEAKQWLANNTPDWAKQNGYFSGTQAERADPTINGQYYDKAFHNYTTVETIKADLKAGLLGDDGDPSVHGSLVTRDGYNDMANDLRDQGTMEYLQRKAASGQGLTTQEAQTYAHLATLYPLLRLGGLGPYGQLTIALRDQDGAATLAAVAGAIPGEGALVGGTKVANEWSEFRTVATAADVAAWRQELNVADGLQTLGVARTDVPGLEAISFKGASPAVYDAAGLPRAAQGEISSPSPLRLFQDHAEQDIANQFIDAVNKAGLSPADLNGKSLNMVISNPTGVCSICVQGLSNPNVPPGVLKQLSDKYPGLTININVMTEPGVKASTGAQITILNGRRVR
jgi:hypothetical protein